MKYFWRAFWVLAVLPFFVYSQSNYKPGYIVTSKGDTVKGFIDYREWEKNPRQVSFKATIQDAHTTEITPGNTAAFAVAGLEYYESHIVSVSMDPIDINHISGKNDSVTMVTDTVFLKVLVSGKYASLYAYTDDLKPRFYLSNANAPAQPQELTYHAYYKEDGDNTLLFNTRYKNQLIFAAQKSEADNDDLKSEISRAKYREDDLVQIVSKINGQSAKQVVSKSLLGLRWFTGAGISYNDMLFGGDIEYPDNYTAFPKISAGIDLFTNKNTQQLSFRVEIGITGDQHTFNNSYEQSQLKVTQYTVSFAPQAYYNFYNGEKLKIFAGGGIAFNFSVYPDRYYVTIGGIDATPIKQNNYPDYHAIWESFIIKAGVAVNKRIEIYGGYSPTITLTDNYERFWGNVVSYQAGINYLFGVK